MKNTNLSTLSKEKLIEMIEASQKANAQLTATVETQSKFIKTLKDENFSKDWEITRLCLDQEQTEQLVDEMIRTEQKKRSTSKNSTNDSLAWVISSLSINSILNLLIYYLVHFDLNKTEFFALNILTLTLTLSFVVAKQTLNKKNLIKKGKK